MLTPQEEAFEKLTKAKARLLHGFPFYAHIILRAPLVQADWIDTMATDMQRIYYNVNFVNSLSVSEIEGVLCHEGLHIAYMHGMRKGERDHRRWNIACDFAINPIILDGGLILPKLRLFDAKYRNMSAEQIYMARPEDQKINVSFDGGTPCKDGQPKDGEGEGNTPMWGGVMKPSKLSGERGKEKPTGEALSEAEKAELEQEIKITIQQAVAIQKSRGKMPAGLEGLIEAVGKPKIDWKEYIQHWVSGLKPDDYTWQRPNRSWFVNHGVYMPRIQFNGCGVGLLSIDTSGSVSDDELIADVNEIAGMIDMCNPDKLFIVQHDSKIQRVDEWENSMDFTKLHIKGRGGTCIQPTFKWIDECDDHIDWIIIFSDMEIYDWPKPANWPDIPTLLCSTGDKDTSPKGTNATYISLRNAMERV